MLLVYTFLYIQGTDPLPNPYADPELCVKLPNDLLHWLYERTRLVFLAVSLSLLLPSVFINQFIDVVFNTVQPMLRNSLKTTVLLMKLFVSLGLVYIICIMYKLGFIISFVPGRIGSFLLLQ